MRGAFTGLVAARWRALPAAAAGLPEQRIETPALAERVASGDLPPVAERVPEEPLVVDLAAKKREPGLPGGTLRMFVTRSKDVRYMAAYGYARLVGFNDDYELVPDLLRDVPVSQDAVALTPLHRRRDREARADLRIPRAVVHGANDRAECAKLDRYRSGSAIGGHGDFLGMRVREAGEATPPHPAPVKALATANAPAEGQKKKS